MDIIGSPVRQTIIVNETTSMFAKDMDHEHILSAALFSADKSVYISRNK
jgi:hypothetical protein